MVHGSRLVILHDLDDMMFDDIFLIWRKTRDLKQLPRESFIALSFL